MGVVIIVLFCPVTFPTIRQHSFTNLKYSLTDKSITRFKHKCILPQRDTNTIMQSRLPPPPKKPTNMEFLEVKITGSQMREVKI
jgi:hypothetical protein